MEEKVKANNDRIKLNKQKPYLVASIVEVIDNPKEEEKGDGSAVDTRQNQSEKCVVVKTSTRQTIFLPVPGLVDPDELRPS